MTVQHILSGHLDQPVTYHQDHDEWVVLLSGAAEIEVHGTMHRLAAGDWLVLPGGIPHVLHTVAPGTSWLAVHAAAVP